MTVYHAKYFAHELTKRCASDSVEKLATALSNAQVDLNPHQIEAALFAFRSPLSKGAILADEVGLGKTIEAGILLAQKWAERKRRLLVICPANLRKQWSQELADKFFLPCAILETRTFNEAVRAGNLNPFQCDSVVICSFQFVRSKEPYVRQTSWDLVIVDEAHRLRNVYKPNNKISQAIKQAIFPYQKALLTATPLQNSLLELYGLVSIIDEFTFGDLKSFRAQFARLTGDADFAELKERLRPICKRTLRKQVLEYIKYTNRHALVQEFMPSADEQRLRAFELRLVKQIVVANATADGGANDAFVRVEQIDYKKGIKAKLRIHTQTPEGPKEKSFAVKNGADLYQLSGERAAYENGFVVAEINAEPANEYIRFNNGRVLRLGEESGGMRDDVWRAQIKHTVKKHLEKELQLRQRGIKVLSLFFVDRVANYRDYDGAGQPVKGKFAEAFEASLAEFAKDPRYAPLDWLKLPFERLHNGYFAQDKKGVLKDTRGDTQADDEVYNLIMKEKERLLSEDEPLRFIFSHSALREGWDNPNVFQICTLNETRSAMKKRQEIGRGLRLPVDQNGQRVFDESVNKLLVMANESYEDFARALQSEYEEDCGVTFGKVPLTAIARITRVVDDHEQPIGRENAEIIRDALVKQKMLDADGRIQPAFDPKKPGFKIDLPEGQGDLTPAVIDLLASYQIERHIRKDQDEGPNRLKKEVQLSPEFKALWDRIKPRTTYRVEFETETLVRRGVDAIKRMEKIEAPKIRVSIGQLAVKRGGIAATAMSVAEERVSAGSYPAPDVLAYLQNETELTRSTLVRILKESGRLADFFTDPQRFMDAVANILKYELHRLLVDGIKYERIGGNGPEAEWEMMLFKNEELVSYLTALQVQHSLYEYVVYDSEIEREFARKLDQREDIKLFVKLPSKFEIDTPVGKYNPDWAIVKQNGQAMYLVRETKGTKDFLKLRTSEADKVRCGQRHFEAIGVPFAVAVTADEV